MSMLRIDSEGPVTRIWLNRPEVRNAFNAELITELRQAFDHLSGDTRVVVLSGEGKAFSAGADLAWMKSSRTATKEENAAGAARLSGLFAAIDEAPQVVVARVNGAALGGAGGLVACSDIVVAAESAKFGFTEVKLGLIPAVISPFVIRKIGEAAARRYFVTGELFDAAEARRIGLVHCVVPLDALDAEVDRIVTSIVSCGPLAVVEAKKLIREIRRRDDDAAREYAVEAIARLRVSDEGQEGLAAFLEKRPPKWV